VIPDFPNSFAYEKTYLWIISAPILHNPFAWDCRLEWLKLGAFGKVDGIEIVLQKFKRMLTYVAKSRASNRRDKELPSLRRLFFGSAVCPVENRKLCTMPTESNVQSQKSTYPPKQGI
jgi:hypothetical protein